MRALAHDIRVLLRERLEAGDTDKQAIDFSSPATANSSCSSRASTPHTLALWLVPPGVLVIGGAGRRRLLLEAAQPAGGAGAARRGEEAAASSSACMSEDG